MKKILHTIIYLCIITTSTSAFAVFDFSSGSINLTETDGRNPGQVLQVNNGVLQLASESSATDTRYNRTKVRLVNTSALLMQADLKIDSVTLGNNDTQSAFVGMAGTYYNVNASPTSYNGDVFTRIAFGDKGNGLEAWYEIFQDDGGDGTYLTRGDIVTSGLSTGTDYTASIEYDGTKTFTFTFNGISKVIDGPTKGGEPFYAQRRVDTGIDHGFDNTTADLNDTIADDGSTASVSAFIDNVTLDSVLVDDFAANMLDTAIWQKNDEYSRIVEGQKLKLVAVKKSNTTEKERSAFDTTEPVDIISASLSFSSESTQDATYPAQSRAMMSGYWYNDGISSSADRTGDVWARMEIRRKSNGDVVCIYSAERSDDANHDTYTDLIPYTESPCSLDTEYDFTIELKSNQLIFTKDSTVVKTYDILTTANRVNGGEYKYVTADVRDGIGKTVVIADNISFVVDSTKGGSTTATTSSSSGGGGGSIPFEMIIFLLAILILFCRRPYKIDRQ
jgi:hypothetical protein